MGFDNDCVFFLHDVAVEYFCPVCRTLVYPNEALQTPCTHLYCKPCLVHIASSTQACPYDGQLVTEGDSKPLVEARKCVAETIGRTLVRCNYHRSGCTWLGPLSDCIVHRSGCDFGDVQVICIICGIQIPHREAEDHAQICKMNQVDLQVQGPAQNQAHDQLAPKMHHPQTSLGHPYARLQLQPHPDGHPQLQNSQSKQVPLAPPQVPTYLPFPLRPLEPPMRFPSRSQAPQIPPAPAQQSVIHQVQQPMTQQSLQPPQVSAGYTSGPIQGHLHYVGPPAKDCSQVCPGGPPQLMQQPPLGCAQTQSSKNYEMDINGPRANSKEIKPSANANNQHKPENGILHPPEHFHPPVSEDQPGVYPQYHFGGSFAPSSAPMLARGPNSFSNHDISFELQHPGRHKQYGQTQSHPSPDGPPGIVSSSESLPLYERDRAPVGKHPDAFPVTPAQHFDQGTESTRSRLNEPGFGHGYTCHAFPSGAPLYAGGSDSFDNLKKRKSMGWCLLCKVECESVKGLKKHCQTFEHQRITMDIINKIKEQSARILEEASNSQSARSRGHYRIRSHSLRWQGKKWHKGRS